jgi:D-sedoheptulose 7-phosphate isomerase
MSFTQNYLTRMAEISRAIEPETIDRAVTILRETRDGGGRLFIIGSGGGAGHASHATCDFRKLGGLETYCPTDNVSELTARINDDGWENSLADMLKACRFRAGDALLVFSVGGGSEEKKISVNLVNAMNLAREVGARVISIVGRDGGHAGKVSDACVLVPTVEAGLVTPLTESWQAVVWHLFVSHPDLQASAAKWESTI